MPAGNRPPRYGFWRSASSPFFLLSSCFSPPRGVAGRRPPAPASHVARPRVVASALVGSPGYLPLPSARGSLPTPPALRTCNLPHSPRPPTSRPRPPAPDPSLDPRPEPRYRKTTNRTFFRILKLPRDVFLVLAASFALYALLSDKKRYGARYFRFFTLL